MTVCSRLTIHLSILCHCNWSTSSVSVTKSRDKAIGRKGPQHTFYGEVFPKAKPFIIVVE